MKLLDVILILVFLVGCKEKSSTSHQVKSYQIKFSSELVWGETSIPVEFTEDDNKGVLEIYRNLNYSVLICSDGVGEYGLRSGRIYVAGEFLDGKPESFKVPVDKSDMAGGFARRKFIMKGWGVRVPYYEYPQHPDDGSLALDPVLRNDLNENDFEEKINIGTLNFDPEEKMYWFGEKPHFSGSE